ncbi:ABC transporter substrate-binding protein [Phascolarctobacterium succinatutens]|uniref:ABC transporter substrate-binding protein n=1 Tax=Phascolarctobacterium succinatutens TaxID=626940 RepID=UPI0026F00E28|nr:ABC transporter substrate-binding protein [Phascolarctobacterium succinatutens]
MKKLFLVIMALSLLLVTGCAKESLSSQEQGSGYTVVDARGKKVTFTSAPKRIVCLNYSATDILTDLIPTDRIIATDMWAREEDLSNCYEKLKGIPVCENNPEQIMKFKPDIVILTDGRANELADTLDSVGIKTCVLRQPKTIQEIPDYIKIVGEVTDTKAAANSLAEKVAAYLKASTEGQKIESVLLIHPNGGIGQKGSMPASICEACNIENLAAKYDFPQSSYLSKEQIIAMNPKRLIVLDWSFGGQHKNAEIRKEEILNDPSYQTVSAVQNGKVVIVPMKYMHCSSQYVMKNLEELKRIMRTTL